MDFIIGANQFLILVTVGEVANNDAAAENE